MCGRSISLKGNVSHSLVTLLGLLTRGIKHMDEVRGCGIEAYMLRARD
jgi:hypothetical protein